MLAHPFVKFVSHSADGGALFPMSVSAQATGSHPAEVRAEFRQYDFLTRKCAACTAAMTPAEVPPKTQMSLWTGSAFWEKN